MIDIIGYIATILISIASFPQLYKSIKTKSTGDISWGYLFLTISSMILWTIYGYYKNSNPVIISSLITIIAYLILSYLKLYNTGACKIGLHKCNYIKKVNNAIDI